MFKSQEDVKSFIIWAKTHKIKRIKIDNVEVEISDLAFIPELDSVVPVSEIIASQTFDDTVSPEAQNKEDEELLFGALKHRTINGI